MEIAWRVLTRRKVITPARSEDTRLSRILSVYDLTALGVGSTLGVGVYVLAGQIAKDTAGPAVVLSFLIAAIASVFAGLCYAEFGARVPRAGSAYIYSYVCVGEFIAYVIGWNLILEYVIGSASVARTLSLYMDTLVNDSMKNAFIDVAPIDIPYMSSYFDFFAFSITLLLALALAFGMKESKWVNNILTILNIGVVLFVIIAGSINADTANWHILPNTTHSNDTVIGDGGFFPFGVDGMIKGAATCFYGFVGFDCIATTGEEVKNPKRAIPISIIASLSIIFLAYFGTSVVITLMVPYYLQDHSAPIPHAFEVIGWEFAKWIVSIGGIFGLAASLFGAMFPLPRIIYAMASDRLVFHFLGQVSERFHTPVIGTIFAGLLTGLMAALFELKQLIDMMSIGTLLAYTIVAASVLLLRYARDENCLYESLPTVSDSDDNEGGGYTGNKAINDNDDALTEDESDYDETYSVKNILRQFFNYKRHKNPSRLSQIIVGTNIFLYCIMCLFIGLCAKKLKTPLSNGENWAIGLTATVVCLAVILIISIATQPTAQTQLNFKVPFVPFIPALSILINIYLMLMLDYLTWIRFGVWMLIGLPLYYLSVNLQPQAHNRGLKTNLEKISENSNVYDNKSYVNTEITENSDDVDAETVLKQLDDVLAEEDLKIESNTYDLNVVADVHCEDRCSVKSLSRNEGANDEETASFYSTVDETDENVDYCEVYVPPPPPLPPGGLPPLPVYNEISDNHIYHELNNNEAVSLPIYGAISGLRPTPDELASVVLRKTNKDDQRKNVVNDTQLPEGHIDFNSPEFKDFKEKLMDTLVPGMLLPIRGNKDQHLHIVTQEMRDLIRDNVDSSNIDRENVKNVLNVHLQKSNSSENVEISAKNSSEKIEISANNRTINNNTQLEIKADKETHSNMMKNVFDAIQSRNNDD